MSLEVSASIRTQEGEWMRLSHPDGLYGTWFKVLKIEVGATGLTHLVVGDGEGRPPDEEEPP